MNIVNSFIGVKVHKQPTKQSILTEGSKVGDKPVEEHDNHLFHAIMTNTSKRHPTLGTTGTKG